MEMNRYPAIFTRENVARKSRAEIANGINSLGHQDFYSLWHIIGMHGWASAFV